MIANLISVDIDTAGWLERLFWASMVRCLSNNTAPATTMLLMMIPVKCFLHPMMPLLTGTISLLMALDRVLAFCKPFYYRTHISKKLWIKCYIMAIIILSVICVLPYIGLGSIATTQLRQPQCYWWWFLQQVTNQETCRSSEISSSVLPSDR
jgi:hypothetical protein